MTAVLGSTINLKNMEADPGVELLCVALSAGFSVTALVMCFSQISGSNLNPVISFALWFTGRLSNRKFVLYVAAQLLASIAAMCIIFATFSNPSIEMYKLVAVKPADGEDLGRIFFTQVLGTFMLTYVAFTMGYEEAALEKEAESKVKQVHASDGLYLFSSSPQSKTGFAPFAVGFIVFVAAVYGGSSGCLLNPSRMFGPAIFSGSMPSFFGFMSVPSCMVERYLRAYRPNLRMYVYIVCMILSFSSILTSMPAYIHTYLLLCGMPTGVWDYFYLYWLGMFTGAGLAALLVVHVQLVHPPPAPLLRE